LSTQLDSRLVITHVFDYPTVLGTKGLDEPFPHLEESAFKMHRSKLEDFCKEHLAGEYDAPNVQLETVENKSVIKGILSKADEYHAHLIVVGMKGASGIREIIMGSIAKQLVEKAPCPVLAIPADTSHMEIKKIVYATDFMEEDVHAIQKLVEIAEPLHAEIKVVHISTKEEYAGDLQMKWFKNTLKERVTYPKIDFQLLFSETVFDSLRIYLGDVGADLMVMLEREKQGFFKKWFHQDLVKKMESYGRVPLMSFNEHNHQILYFKV